MTATPTPNRLVEWSPEYAATFAELRDFLMPAVAPLGGTVEHVGSTSVPGMYGKPVLDVDAVLPARDSVPAAVAALTELGYRHRGDLGVAGREAFDRPAQLPLHHMYVVVDGSAAHHDHVDLRDYLCSSQSAVQRYAVRKRELADVLATDRTAYTEAKSDVVQQLLAEARSRR